MATLKKLLVPDDFPLRNIGQLDVSFPPYPAESEKIDDGEEANAEEAAGEADAEVFASAKSFTLNDQALDLTKDDRDEVSKSASLNKATFGVKVLTAEKSLDQTLLEINAEIVAKKSGQNAEAD